MTRERFKEIKYLGSPYPDIFVGNQKYKIESIQGDYFIADNGDEIFYINGDVNAYEIQLSLTVIDAIKIELIDCYHYGSEKLESICNRLALKYKVKANRINRINANLTIKDIVDMKKLYKL